MSFQKLLGLRLPAVAVAFRDAPPPGVPRVDAAGPSGCSYWKLAAEGMTFYTAAEDHYNCPIGSYTHGAELPPAKQQELMGLVGTMVQLGYVAMEEVPAIPRRAQPLKAVVYAPYPAAAFEPDVVLVRGNARQIMVLAEAAHAAGAASGDAMLRPTCAAIPAAMQSQKGALSLGCIGNRVYTGLGDDEMYFALPGPKVAAVLEKLAGLVHANRELEKFHRERALSNERSRTAL